MYTTWTKTGLMQPDIRSQEMLLESFKASLSKHTNFCVNPFFVRTSGAARDGHMKHERVELRLS